MLRLELNHQDGVTFKHQPLQRHYLLERETAAGQQAPHEVFDIPICGCGAGRHYSESQSSQRRHASRVEGWAANPSAAARFLKAAMLSAAEVEDEAAKAGAGTGGDADAMLSCRTEAANSR